MDKQKNNQVSCVKTTWSGLGTETNPFLLKSEDDLIALSSNVNYGEPYTDTYFRQENNIDLTKKWIPIGTARYSFNGNYDGNYYAVSNVDIVYPAELFDASYLGLFGNVDSNGKIKNLAVAGKITNTAPNVVIGSITAKNHGEVINCASDVSIKSIDTNCHIGGIIGINHEDAKTEKSFNVGEILVTGENDSSKNPPCIGGIAGKSQSQSHIMYCYNNGKITAPSKSIIGGICGKSATKYIEFCFNIASISSSGGDFSSTAGAVIGACSDIDARFRNCYYLDKILDITNTFGQRKTKEEITSNSFLDLLNKNTLKIFYKDILKGACGCKMITSPHFKVFQENEKISAMILKSVLISDNAPVFTKGNGLEANPYQIETKEQLRHIDKHNTCCFKLVKSLELSAMDNTLVKQLKGTFDGNNFTITIHIMYIQTWAYDCKLFGIADEKAKVKNLIFGMASGSSDSMCLCGTNKGIIENCVYIKESIICQDNFGFIRDCYSGETGIFNYCGKICSMNNGNIHNCYNSGNPGGICDNNRGIISNCYNTGNISSTYNGGICRDNDGTITNCYNAGTISISYGGGICMRNNGTITNCYNTGSLSTSYGGGICESNNGTITNCYNAGSVSTSYGGGICNNNKKTITNTYYNKDIISKGIDSGDSSGVIGKTTNEMITSEFAKLLGKNAGFILASHSGERHYPELKVFAESTNPKIKEASQKSTKL